MRHLLSSDYFPYGSQYYRAPSPPPGDWERDLAAMAGLGFNLVKFWLQWRWNHPAEGRFYFDDIDRLMDLSQENGLKVMLNTIVDVAPAWIYTTYPDASMVTLDGRRIGPQTQPHRQIGGLGVCLNHEAVMEHLFRFLEVCIARYATHPALEIWNVGSEPELTQSMAELRRYAGDASRMGDMLCYCDHCRSKFRAWLGTKYESVDRLNAAWNRNYQSFEEAELPKTRNTFNDLIDWRMFFVHTLGVHVRRRFEVAGRVDAGRHPLMCHHVFIQGFPVTSTANDPWNVGAFGDLHGMTQMDDPMMHDILRSCARGKPVLSAEMLMLMGYTLDLPRAIDANDVKRHIFTGVAANLKGFLFWQYRPEMLGRETPTWGLSHLDGSETPWLRAFAGVGEVLQRNADFLFRARPRAAEVAMLYHPENQVFAWAATGREQTATDSLLGFHRALYEASHPIDFIHPKDFESGRALDVYRVIVLSFPYVLNETIAAQLRAWVDAGGVLISEAYCGGWHLEEGRHHTTVPGYGLHEVFGVRQRNAEPAGDHRFLTVHGAVRAGQNLHLRPGLNQMGAGHGFVIAHAYEAGGGQGHVELTLTRDLPGLQAGQVAYGALVRETFEVEHADLLATYADGEPAITAAAYGHGKAILIGSFVGLPYQRAGYPTNAALITGLVDYAAGLERPRVTGAQGVRVDVLRTEAGEAMVILQNGRDEPADVAIRLTGEGFTGLSELFSGDRPGVARARGETVLTLALAPNEVRVYRTS